MKKLVIALTALAVVTAVVVPGVGADADTVVECDGPYPIFDSTAMTEEENQARIACVEERIEVKRDRIAERKATKAELTQKIRRLERRREAVKDRIARDRAAMKPLSKVVYYLRIVTGDIAWLRLVAECESHGDPDVHSESGTYHGKYQFDLPSWGNRFGIRDPHTAHHIEQDAGAALEKDERGTSPWPNCG